MFLVVGATGQAGSSVVRELGRPVRIRTTPVGVFTAGHRLLTRVARELGVHPLRTVEQALREKAALPAG